MKCTSHYFVNVYTIVLGHVLNIIVLNNYFHYSARRAHTQSTKDWLNILERENVPVLLCLTFADKLFAELMGENGDCDIGKVKIGLKEQLNVRSVQLVILLLEKHLN
jgi:hypothetical protein